MPGIYIAALLTTGLALVFYGQLIHRMPGEVDRRWLGWAFLMTLPMEPFSFYCVRLPLDSLLHHRLGLSGPGYEFLRACYAPLTEEPAKLVPLLWPALCGKIRPENVARFALAIGLGFGLGEMWLLANLLAPASAATPMETVGFSHQSLGLKRSR